MLAICDMSQLDKTVRLLLKLFVLNTALENHRDICTDHTVKFACFKNQSGEDLQNLVHKWCSCKQFNHEFSTEKYSMSAFSISIFIMILLISWHVKFLGQDYLGWSGGYLTLSLFSTLLHPWVSAF